MPVIFARNTGRVIAIEDKVAAGSIQLGNVVGGDGGERISYARHNTIITRIGISAAGNFQFLHTIGNDVYVYVFGDRMGQVQLHGLSFAAACQPSSAGGGSKPKPQGNRTVPAMLGSNKKAHGFELLFQWYTANRIAARKAPVKVVIGLNTNFHGFVTALTGDVQDALHRTIQFQMTIALLPDVVSR
jgi:hypothetical protein